MLCLMQNVNLRESGLSSYLIIEIMLPDKYKLM